MCALREKKVSNITRNGPINSCTEFLKTFQNTYFTEHLLFSPSLEVGRVNFTTFCQLDVIIQVKSQKTKYDMVESGALQYYSCRV